VEGKIKYAKFKAADIMKALREGRVPTPGPPGEDQPVSPEPEESSDIIPPPPISEFPSPPSNFTAPLSPSGQQDHSISTADVAQPHFVAQTPPPPPVFQPTATPPPVIQPPVQPVQQNVHLNLPAAQKNAKWAISALEYDDITTARTQLLSALENIGFNQSNNFGF
jgi:vacuolar protein sorting-associated protein VTA1